MATWLPALPRAAGRRGPSTRTAEGPARVAPRRTVRWTGTQSQGQSRPSPQTRSWPASPETACPGKVRPVWSPADIPARRASPRRTAAAGSATGERAAHDGPRVRQAGSEEPRRALGRSGLRPPASSPDPCPVPRTGHSLGPQTRALSPCCQAGVR